MITFMFCGYCLEFNRKGNCSCSLCSASFKAFCDREELCGNECYFEEENIVLKKGFGRILLTHGAGHIEKNLLLATFKFCKVSVKIEF